MPGLFSLGHHARMASVTLRTVERFDEPAFTQLVDRLLHDPDRREAGALFFGTGGTPPTPTTAQQVRVGAFDGDTLVGWSHAFLQHGGTLYVANSAVEIAYRRQGLYTRLVDAMEVEARALGCLRIESHHRTANPAVLIAKLKAGFTIVGTEYSAEMGLLVKMCKQLDARRDAVMQGRSGTISDTMRLLRPPQR